MIATTSRDAFWEGVRKAVPFMLPLRSIYIGFGAACASSWLSRAVRGSKM